MAGQPRFFSLEYHLQFLPGVILARLRRTPRQQPGFMPSGTVEVMVLIAVCAVLLMIGVPGLAEPEPGWGSIILTALGGAGALALLSLSVYWTRGVPVSYERFDVGLFFFMVILGATAGIWTAVLTDPERFVGRDFRLGTGYRTHLFTVAGLVAGYLAGVPAALWVQRLGPVGAFITVFALPGIVGLIVTDAVILSL